MADQTEPPPHLYKLLWKMEHLEKGLTAEEAKEKTKEGYGACDAMLIASIIYPEDGSLSVMFFGQDGRTKKELEDIEWFKVWMSLTSRLARSHTLDENRKAFLRAVFAEIVRAMQQAGGN